MSDIEGTSADAARGPLFVTSAAAIVLDMNGHNIDRKLAEPVDDGGVIFGCDCNLTIKNSVPDQGGKITGGNSKKLSEEFLDVYHGFGFTDKPRVYDSDCWQLPSGGGIFITTSADPDPDAYGSYLTISEGVSICGNKIVPDVLTDDDDDDVQSSAGGGMFLYGTKLVMNGARVCDNAIIINPEEEIGGDHCGGGIYAEYSGIFISGSSISNNSIQGGDAVMREALGGGIYYVDPSEENITRSVYLTNCSIEGNSAVETGGVWIEPGTDDLCSYFDNVRFVSNKAMSDGSALSVQSTCNVFVNGCSFESNSGCETLYLKSTHIGTDGAITISGDTSVSDDSGVIIAAEDLMGKIILKGTMTVSDTSGSARALCISTSVPYLYKTSPSSDDDKVDLFPLALDVSELDECEIELVFFDNSEWIEDDETLYEKYVSGDVDIESDIVYLGGNDKVVFSISDQSYLPVLLQYNAAGTATMTAIDYTASDSISAHLMKCGISLGEDGYQSSVIGPVTPNVYQWVTYSPAEAPLEINESNFSGGPYDAMMGVFSAYLSPEGFNIPASEDEDDDLAGILEFYLNVNAGDTLSFSSTGEVEMLVGINFQTYDSPEAEWDDGTLNPELAFGTSGLYVVMVEFREDIDVQFYDFKIKGYEQNDLSDDPSMKNAVLLYDDMEQYPDKAVSLKLGLDEQKKSDKLIIKKHFCNTGLAFPSIAMMHPGDCSDEFMAFYGAPGGVITFPEYGEPGFLCWRDEAETATFAALSTTAAAEGVTNYYGVWTTTAAVIDPAYKVASGAKIKAGSPYTVAPPTVYVGGTALETQPALELTYYTNTGTSAAPVRGTLVAGKPTSEGKYVLHVEFADDVTKYAADPVDYAFEITGSGPSHIHYDEEEEKKPDDYTACKKDADCILAEYSDLKTDDWYHDGLHYCLQNGILKGYSDKTFRPAELVSREMIALMLWRANGCPETDSELTFVDVSEKSIYADAIRWATSEKLMFGYSEDYFHPAEAITRQQLAAVIYRAAQRNGKGFTGSWMFLLDAPDRTSVSSYAYEAVCWCCMNNIMQGGSDGYFRPANYANRAHAAVMLQRFLTLEK